MFARQAFWFVHGAYEWANIIATDRYRHHLPRFLEVDSLVLFDALYKHFGHKWHISTGRTNLGQIQLTFIVIGPCILYRITEQIWIEFFENVWQSRRVTPTPLAANAPRQASIFDEQIGETNRCCTRCSRQRIAQSRNYVDITWSFRFEMSSRTPKIKATTQNKGPMAILFILSLNELYLSRNGP